MVQYSKHADSGKREGKVTRLKWENEVSKSPMNCLLQAAVEL